MVKDPKNFLLGSRGGKPKPKEYVQGLLYHATPTERVEEISKSGVTPQYGEKRQWNHAFRSGDDHVYAWAHPRRALEHAERQERRTGKPQSVIAIKTEHEGDDIKGGWHGDPTATMDRLGSLRRKEPVPPSDIVDVHHLKGK